MELLLLLTTTILAFIAYKLDKLVKINMENNKNPSSQSSTSLNPIFSENEINTQKILYEKWQKKVEYCFENLHKIEHKEITEHHNKGKNKTEFVPSPNLKDITLQLLISASHRKLTKARFEKMIEANISILNGKTIAEISTQFQAEHGSLPSLNTNISTAGEQYISAMFGEEIKNDYDDGLKERSGFWLRSWDEILAGAFLEAKNTI